MSLHPNIELATGLAFERLRDRDERLERRRDLRENVYVFAFTGDDVALLVRALQKAGKQMPGSRTTLRVIRQEMLDYLSAMNADRPPEDVS